MRTDGIFDPPIGKFLVAQLQIGHSQALRSPDIIFFQLTKVMDGIGYLTAFIVILSINIRYIPMSLSASNHIKTKKLNKGLLAHWLADESYAVETKEDDLKD